MCVATSTIIAVSVAGASVASSQIAAAKGRTAAKKAAEAQTTSADQALEVQRSRYQQERADFDPYLQAGRGAHATMATQAGTPTQGFHQGPPVQLGTPLGTPTPAGPSGPAPAGQMAPPDAPNLQPGGLMGPGRAATPLGAPPAAGGALWTIQAPDGETKQLPPDVAQQFMARGAKRVA